MSGYRDRFVRAGGLTLHLLDWGDRAAPAVFLFHPTGGHAHVWDKVAEPLASRYRVIALDARDHGDSDSSPAVFDPAIKADEVIEIANSLGIGRFSVAGNSMGGRLAALLAFRHPERIQRLVLEDVGPELGPDAAKRTEEQRSTRKSEYDSVEELAASLRLTRPYAPDEWLLHLVHFGSVPTATGGRLLKHRTHIPWTPIETPEERWAQLPHISCPTLVVRGADSVIMDEGILARTVAGIPDARGFTIPRADHAVHEDNIAGYLEVVLPFFDIQS